MAGKPTIGSTIISKVDPEIADTIIEQINEKAKELVPGIVVAANKAKRRATCVLNIIVTPRAQKEGGVKWYLTVTAASTLPTEKYEKEVDIKGGQLVLPGIKDDADAETKDAA